MHEETASKTIAPCDCRHEAKYGFILAFKLHCEKCGHTDFIKLSNIGWQGGQHRQALDRFRSRAS